MAHGPGTPPRLWPRAPGETDDYGDNVVEVPVHIHDRNATILHRLGIDHRRLSYQSQGLDMRLTGVEGHHPVKGILA